MSAQPQFSDVDLLGYGKRIVHLDPSDSGRVLSEGRNKLGRLVVELAILVSLPRWAPVDGEEDHPEAEFFYSPRPIHFCGMRCL